MPVIHRGTRRDLPLYNQFPFREEGQPFLEHHFLSILLSLIPHSIGSSLITLLGLECFPL